MTRFVFSCFFFIFALLSFAPAQSVSDSSDFNYLPTPSEFSHVPDDARPWAYYWWLKGNVTEESITNDLTSMRNLGFGGVLVFDSRGYHEDAERHIPVPLTIRHEFMTNSWRKLMIHLISEADRLGMKVSLNLSNTGGHLRGPWDFEGDGPRTLITSTMKIREGEKIEIPLTAPQNQRFFKDVAVLAVRIDGEGKDTDWCPAAPPKENAPLASETIDLSGQIPIGKIIYTVPNGDWRLVRFGTVVIGDLGSVDILNEKVIADYFDRMAGTIIRETDEFTDRMGKKSLIGKTLTHFYNVSWEGGNPNWTDGFDQFFAEKRGYEIVPYLPILAGFTIVDGETSDRFMTDFHKTIADAFCENCYRKIGELCHEKGLLWHSEDGGPWNRQAPMFVEGDMLTFWGQNDIAQGEFWMNESGPANPQSNLKFAASASHIYGRRLTASESFTHMTYHWTMFPALLKPAADRNFIDGANMFIWHTFTASPQEVGKPGYEYFAGTHINSNVTWQRDAGPFVTYLGRCQSILRKGDYVADFCVYASDKNYTIWGRGEKWNPDSKWTPPEGTAYDLLNSDVLIHRLEMKNGRFTLPGGMSYRFLVLDPIEEELPLPALRKILRLIEEGGTVLLGEKRPVRCRGLSDGADGDEKLAEVVSKLWGDDSETNKKIRRLGKGTVYQGRTPSEVMSFEKILLDFDGPFEYHHRHLADGDIYFVVNPLDENVRGDCRFRTSKKFATLWNPVTGGVTPIHVAPTEDARSVLTLDLPKHGSMFVVFSNDSLSDQREETDFSGATERTLNGPWSVSFDPAWGGPSETVTFENLTAWNENEDERIRYYSGTAIYRTTFHLTAEEIKSESQFHLELGTVAVIARVRINGVDGGVVWTDPWRLDFPENLRAALKEGENTLEIDVTNCWVNRLIGDASLPSEKRVTKTNVQYYPDGGAHYAYQGYGPDEPLRTSGLLGPVRLWIQP